MTNEIRSEIGFVGAALPGGGEQAASGGGAAAAAGGAVKESGEARRALRLDDAAALELDRRAATLLAFGSQLLHGSVGLNAAERVYARNDIRPVRVPTILLSVMPHYAAVHDIRVPPAWLAEALADLAAAGALADIELVTAGYFASPGQPAALADWFAAQPADARPPLILDPTLGDTELGFYTDPGLVQALREELVPIAAGIVPNLFELAHLSGRAIESLTSRAAIEDAARSLMSERTEWIAVTGVRLTAAGLVDAAGVAGVAGVTETTGHAAGTAGTAAPRVCEILVRPTASSIHAHRAFDTRAKGLGDTFTAALVAALLTGQSAEEAVDSGAAEVRASTRALLTPDDAP